MHTHSFSLCVDILPSDLFTKKKKYSSRSNIQQTKQTKTKHQKDIKSNGEAVQHINECSLYNSELSVRWLPTSSTLTVLNSRKSIRKRRWNRAICSFFPLVGLTLGNCIAFNAYESQTTTVKMIGFTHFVDRITAAGIKTAAILVLYDRSNTSSTSSAATASAFYMRNVVFFVFTNATSSLQPKLSTFLVFTFFSRINCMDLNWLFSVLWLKCHLTHRLFKFNFILSL